MGASAVVVVASLPLAPASATSSVCSKTTPALGEEITCEAWDTGEGWATQQDVTIPSGSGLTAANYIQFTVKGAGGAGGATSGAAGGKGAQVTGYVSLSGVDKTQPLQVQAGAGGYPPNGIVGGGGGGGGASALRVNIGGTSTYLVIAGGGGGGAGYVTGGAPGSGVGGNGAYANTEAGGSGASASFGGASAEGGGGGSGGTGGAGGGHSPLGPSQGCNDDGSTAGTGATMTSTQTLAMFGENGGGACYNNPGSYPTSGGGGGIGYGGGGGGGAAVAHGVMAPTGGGGAGGSYADPARGSSVAYAPNGGSGGAVLTVGSIGQVIFTFLNVLPPPTVTTSSLANGTVGSPYSQVLAATGGSGTYPNWQVTSGSLPVGLALNQATGTVYGTPTAAGTSTFSVTVTDSDAATSAAASLTLTVTAGGGGGGGGSSESSGDSSASAAPTPSASASASASASVAPSAPSRLEPAAPGSNPNLPAGGLPAGGSVLLVNGQSVPLTVSPNAPMDPVALVFTAPGLNMRLEGRGDQNDPLGLTSKQALILQSEGGSGSATAARSAVLAKTKVKPVARTSGDGFAPRTPVKLYLLTVGYLGEVTTDASGAFAGSVPIPPGITPGVYTLQANGFAPDFSVRSLSIGVLVKPTAGRTATVRTQVYFEVLSPALSDAAKASLRKVASKAKSGAGVVRSVVVGYVQPTNASGNDQSLSGARADAVAAYLRSLGVKGVYVVRGDGKASQSGATARRVNVAVTYRLG